MSEFLSNTLCLQIELQVRVFRKIFFSYFSTKTHVVNTHWNHLIEEKTSKLCSHSSKYEIFFIIIFFYHFIFKIYIFLILILTYFVKTSCLYITIVPSRQFYYTYKGFKMTPHPSVRDGWGALLEWDLRPRACMTLAINLARNYLDALLKILNLEYIW